MTLYGLFALLSGLSYGFTMPYLNLLLARQFGLSAPVIGGVLAMNEAALFLGSFFTPLIMDRIGAEKILGPLLAIVCLANAALSTSMDLVAFAALLLIRSAANMVYAPTFDSAALGSVPDADRAAMQSFRALMRGVGTIVSVWGGGLFLTWRAYGLAFAATSVVTLVMFVFYRGWLRSVPHDGAKPA
ncbi:MAG: MFS transporter [Bacilli bacterium]